MFVIVSTMFVFFYVIIFIMVGKRGYVSPEGNVRKKIFSALPTFGGLGGVEVWVSLTR